MTLVLHATNGVTFPNGDTQVGATKVLQIKRTTYTTQAVLSTGFPADDTIPQITEGDQIFSIAMTAGHANNLLEFNINMGDLVGSSTGPGIALFNGATAAIWGMEYPGFAPRSTTFTLVAGTTDAKTYTLRVGDSSGNNTTMNTTSLWGAGTPGMEIATMTIKEIEV